MKEGTHKLMTLDFWRICISNFLLYAAVWMLLPILPAESYLSGFERTDITLSMLLFVITMIGVGPLHAYLGDAHKRKHVLLQSTLALALCAVGSLLITQVWHLWILMAFAGAMFGIATTAGITVAIDITQSHRRGAGNRMYAFSGALGLLTGLCLLSRLYLVMDYQPLVYISLALLTACLITQSGVYVAFRAPVGVGWLNIDRFFLPNAWLPAVNICVLTMGIGMTTSLLPPYTWLSTLTLVALTIGVVPLTRMFVKLSHHCQRGTANTTLQLSMMLGLLMGMMIGECVENSLIISIVVLSLSLLALWLITWPYFKRNRVRK